MPQRCIEIWATCDRARRRAAACGQRASTARAARRREARAETYDAGVTSASASPGAVRSDGRVRVVLDAATHLTCTLAAGEARDQREGHVDARGDPGAREEIPVVDEPRVHIGDH